MVRVIYDGCLITMTKREILKKKPLFPTFCLIKINSGQFFLKNCKNKVYKFGAYAE